MPVPATRDLLGGLDDPFARFWAAYPKRTPNPRARAAAEFARAVRRFGVRPHELIEAARAFAAEQARLAVRPEYIPHARTWLAQERWRDYPPFAPAVEEAAPALEVPPEVAAHAWWSTAGRLGVAPHEFRAFLAPLVVREWHAYERATVLAPSRFVADTVRARFLPVLARVLDLSDPRSVEVLP